MGVLPRLVDSATELSKRYYSNCGYGYYYSYGSCYYSGWSAWGRWVVLAVIVVIAFLVFLSFSCITARRRRRRGQQPLMGTGWMAPAGHGPAQYTGNNQYPMNNQPQYQPPSYPPHQGAAADYYSGQEGGVTQPGQTYQPQRGGDHVYAPPPGPPPDSKY